MDKSKLRQIEKNLRKAIDNGKVIRIISYAMSSSVEKVMDRVIQCLLEKYNKEDLKSVVYTCIKELMINGTKANIKRIFFEENGLDIYNETDYKKGIALYKEVMKEELTLEYGKRAKLKGLYVKVNFIHSAEVLKIEIVNNTEITPQEEVRLREKFANIMKYDDLMQYYMDYGDDTEGAGMGLALIMILLMAEGIDPGFFRVGISNNATVAKLEIPIVENYECDRDRDHVIRIHD
ncbi:MAG: hypothetical protein JW881_13035 [Spirochaetales bacterium]|nr:hypothetical protein [Spirochaetales bacterium]